MRLITVFLHTKPEATATRYGEAITAMVQLPDGTEHSLWTANDPDFRYLLDLDEGDAVRVGLHKNGKLSVLVKDDALVAPPRPTGQQLVDEFLDIHRKLEWQLTPRGVGAEAIATAASLLLWHATQGPGSEIADALGRE